MLVKVETWIYIEVEDEAQADEAVTAINSGLERRMVSFPEGDVVDVNVESWEKVSSEEADSRGLVE